MKLSELETLAVAATPGPWKIGYNDNSGKYNEKTGEFSLVTERDD